MSFWMKRTFSLVVVTILLLISCLELLSIYCTSLCLKGGLPLQVVVVLTDECHVDLGEKNQVTVIDSVY